MISRFVVRVYGILEKEGKYLLLEEDVRGWNVVKFPGGGLEFGEGLTEGLKREFREEFGLEVEVLEHFYTTDFFVPSVFDTFSQVLSVYYKVSPKDENAEIRPMAGEKFTVKWIEKEKLHPEQITLVIDKKVAGMLIGLE